MTICPLRAATIHTRRSSSQRGDPPGLGQVRGFDPLRQPVHARAERDAPVPDPYSQLLSPKDYEDLQIHTQGNYEGLGIRIDVVDQVLTVISPIEGTPAYKAGLLPGDRIVNVDGVPTRGWTEEKAVQELRGPQGSEVTLSIAREGWTSRSK